MQMRRSSEPLMTNASSLERQQSSLYWLFSWPRYLGRRQCEEREVIGGWYA